MRRVLGLVIAIALINGLMPESHVSASSNEWQPVGDPITNDSEDILNGVRVDMDDAGDTVAVASIEIDAEIVNQRVAIYDWSQTSGEWELRGDPISTDLNLAGDFGLFGLIGVLGAAIDLSGDGNTLAVASPLEDVTSSDAVGGVMVYWWNDGVAEWEPQGSIPTPDSAFVFGWSLSLSDDGMTIAVSSLDQDLGCEEQLGKVYVFDWNSPSWDPRDDFVACADIDGLGVIGTSVAVSGNGNTIAVSGLFLGGGAASAVLVRQWDPLGEPASWGELSGFPVDPTESSLPGALKISNDGESIAVSKIHVEDTWTVAVDVFDRSDTGWHSREELALTPVPVLPLSSMSPSILGGVPLTPDEFRFEPSSFWDELPDYLILILLIFSIYAQLFGASIDISGDATSIAVNQLDLTGESPFAGPSVFDWDVDRWQQRGETIDASALSDDSFVPLSIAMNNDGTRLISGQIENLVDGGAGRVLVYEWSPRARALPKKRVVELDAAGGTCAGKSSWTVTQRRSVTLPTASDCTRDGYTLLGWTRDPANTAPENLLHNTISRSGTVTAVWGKLPNPPSAVYVLRDFLCNKCGNALVIWQATDTDITGFTVTVDDTPNACTPTTLGTWWLCGVSGLTPNQPHTFGVSIQNTNGTSSTTKSTL